MNVSPVVLQGAADTGRCAAGSSREADGEVGHEHVALLSYAFAERQPGGVDARSGGKVSA